MTRNGRQKTTRTRLRLAALVLALLADFRFKLVPQAGGLATEVWPTKDPTVIALASRVALFQQLFQFAITFSFKFT